MADASRGAGDGLAGQLARQPERFEFHQALRLLERGAAARVGEDARPDDEPVRLRVTPSLRFPSAGIAAFTPTTADEPAELSVPFGGLFGPHGVLPQHYTALLQQRVRAKDYSLRDFLDLFHHRLLGLQQRAWEQARLPVAHEADDECAGTTAVRAVAGAGTPGLRGRAPFADDVFLEFAALFNRRPPTAAGLELVLHGYFGWPVRVEEFAGRWLYLDDANRTRVGTAAAPHGVNAALGRDAVIGRRVWEVQSQVRVRVGPLDYPAFRSLQPLGDARAAFAELARAYVGVEFDLEIVPVLAAEAVPPAELNPDEVDGPRVGRNLWLSGSGLGRDAGDATFAAG